MSESGQKGEWDRRPERVRWTAESRQNVAPPRDVCQCQIDPEGRLHPRKLGLQQLERE
jgi:hypothetical protein